MKHLIWIIFMASMSVLGQVQYEFDHVVVYEEYGTEGAPNSKINNGYSYTFINSNKESYYLTMYTSDKGEMFLLFRDLRNKIIGRGTISEEKFYNTETFVVGNWVQFDKYSNSTKYNETKFYIDSTQVDSAKIKYSLRRKRNRKQLKTGIVGVNYILDNELSSKYKRKGFNRFKKFFSNSKNKKRDGIIVERSIDSIDGSTTIKQKLDTIYRISRKVVLSKKSYYTPKIRD